MWNVQCALGKRIKTPQEWGDLVRSGYPDYTGTRPRFQFWHGTADHVLYPENFFEGIKQWTNVFGVSQTPTSNYTNDPHTGYSRASFGPNVQAILAQCVNHTVPEEETDVLDWISLLDSRPSSRTDITGARLVQCDGAGCTDSTGAWSSPAVAPQCDLPVAFPPPVCAAGLTQTYIDPCQDTSACAQDASPPTRLLQGPPHAQTASYGVQDTSARAQDASPLTPQPPRRTACPESPQLPLSIVRLVHPSRHPSRRSADRSQRGLRTPTGQSEAIAL